MRHDDCETRMVLQQGYEQLGPAFVTHLRPTPITSPHWIARNHLLAQQLQLPSIWWDSPNAVDFWAGNQDLPQSLPPYASVYSGHQFGSWAGQLGDGRAITLGQTPSGFEIQLKGSGRTPYSRGGDGRAVLRSSIREYLCSLAMHSLGVPTTQALCLVGSTTPVQREQLETAAVVTRVAPSFLRFGHFEHFAARHQYDELTQLVQYTIQHHYPTCASEPTLGLQTAALLKAVTIRTAQLIAQWQAIGFCHGVINTDNMSVLGLTIDYGPFQFLDHFNPQHICNHSDTQGRYAFHQQPNIAYWNLYCLAQSLMPLIQDDAIANDALNQYPTHFNDAFRKILLCKMGFENLDNPSQQHHELIDNLLIVLAKNKVDYTIFWRKLSQSVQENNDAYIHALFSDCASWNQWYQQYQKLCDQQDQEKMAQSMMKINPKFILRNYMAEMAIQQATMGDFSVLQTLEKLLTHPFDEHEHSNHYASSPPSWASSLSISCSS